MTSETPEQVVAHFQERFGPPTYVELHAVIVLIWLAGATQQLACLGVIGGGKMREVEGLDKWADIDRHRYRLIPPNLLGHCRIGFAEAAATEDLRKGLAELITMYYTDTGRQEIATKAFDRIFLNSPSKQ